MKKIFILLAILIFLISLPLATAFTIEEGTCIEPSASNTNYTLGNDFSFTELEVKNNAPYFDSNIFCIEADSGTANVTIHSLSSMSFTVEATDNVVFTLGGFTAETEYEVHVDGVKWRTVTTGSNGVLSFSYDSWSNHTFDIILSAARATASSNLIRIIGTASTLFVIMAIVMLGGAIIGLLSGGAGSGAGLDIIIEAIIVVIMAVIFFIIVLAVIGGTL